MSLYNAAAIVRRLGPATVALDRACDPDLAQELALAGCRVIAPAAAGADATGFVRWGDAGHDEVIERAGTLVVASGSGERSAVERHLFARGWSHHPGGGDAADWAASSPATLPPLAWFRRADLPDGHALRLAGGEGDALLALAARAAGGVRPGDAVLIAGAQADAVGAVVAHQSRARDVTIASAIAPALADAPPQGLDAAILILADPAEARAAVGAAQPALRPDGRLMLVWLSEGGDLASVGAVVDETFLSETWVLWRTGAGTLLDRWPEAQRGDAVLLIASANPLLAAEAPPYAHPAFAAEAGPLVDFAAAYANPWLYRVLVQLGERLGDEVKLARLAECVLEEAAAGSADRGAAIAVLGYRVVDLRLTDAAASMIALIEAYLAETDGSRAPHRLRWRLSLLFLAGRLAELAEETDAALAWYGRAAAADWQGFSPLLATKAIAARYHAARLLIAAGRHAAALDQFRAGLATALAAAAAPHGELIGSIDAPLPFYLPEMAEVLDMGAQCANALAAAPLLARDVGLFWRQVDTKRFGLFAWADAMARENARLHRR